MGLTRRKFIQQLGTTTLVAAAPIPLAAANAAATTMPLVTAPPAADAVHVTLKINDATHALEVQPREVLLDVLRERLGFTGAKKGCDHGQCGACTVLVNGRRVLSCLSLAATHDGDEITTVEGLERDGELHPMQQAFLDHDAYQCGYCTCGQIVSAVGLMREPVAADDAAVREAMSGNLCRCGAYQRILAAVQSARHAV